MSTPKGATKDPQPEPLHVHNAVAAKLGVDVDALLAEIADEIAQPRGGAQ